MESWAFLRTLYLEDNIEKQQAEIDELKKEISRLKGEAPEEPEAKAEPAPVQDAPPKVEWEEFNPADYLTGE